MSQGRVQVRLVDAHPAASRREVASFKNVKTPEAIRLLAGAQILLWGTTSMWRCEVKTTNGWRPIGPQNEAWIKEEVQKLSKLWHPMNDLKVKI